MRLHTKITRLIIVVTLGVGLSSAFMADKMMYAELERESHEKALLAVQILSEHIAHHLTTDNIEMVNKAAADLVQHSKNILYAYVVDPEGNLITHSFNGDFPQDLRLMVHQHSPSARNPVVLLRHTKGGRILDIAYPLIEGQPAHLHIGMNAEYMYAHAATLRNNILGLTLLLTIVGIVIGVFVSRHITRPLSEMADAMRDYGAGKESEKLGYGGGLEMTQLAQTFNQMLLDRKKAGEELRRSEERFQEIVETSSDIIWETDANGIYTYVSPECKKILGYPPQQIIGKTPFDFMPSGEAKRMTEIFKELTIKGESIVTLENINLHKNGHSVILETNGNAVFNTEKEVIGYRGVDRDVTERKLANETLLASEERFRGIFENTKSGVSVYEAVDDGDDFVFLDLNSRGEQIEHISRKELIGRRLTEAYPGVREFGILDVLKRVWQTGKPEHHPITMYADERIQGWRENFIFRISSSELVVVYEDVTERKKMETERERLQQFMQTVIDAIPESLMVINRDYSIALANQKVCQLAGDNDPVTTGQTCHQLSHDSTVPCGNTNHPCPLEQVVETKAPVMVEHTHHNAEGHAIPVEIIAAPIFNEQGEVVQIVESSRDVSDRARLLAQLHQAQKMESVGRLAGGVAHDFNNMLAVILGNTELALMQTDPEHPLVADLEEIRYAANRSADLTRQLLAFARKQTVAPVVLDINETVESMLKMLQRLIGEDIDLAWRPGVEIWPVKVDPSQIDQILANLCVNARDAIVDVGKVTIETGNTAFDQEYCANNIGFISGDFVLLAVSDNGCGMDRETVGKIFEPFFTTKGQGEGTGLGMSTIYGIVKQNNGFINVYSEPDQGTTIKIYLPRHKCTVEQEKPEDIAMPVALGQETILIVEDETAMLRITTMMLQKQGYTIHGASSPAEALQLAEQHVGKINLILTDVVMPGMNGRDLATKLNCSYPDMRCLFMSGYTSNVIAHHGVLDEGYNFIQKPFSREDLATKVRETLDAG